MRNRLLLALLFALPVCGFAQTDSTVADEDWDMYGKLDFADKGAKRFCTSKVLNLSPARLISIGYEAVGGASLSTPAATDPAHVSFAPDTAVSRIGLSHGLRLQANIPLVSRNNIIWQMNLNYQDQYYLFENAASLSNPLQQWLSRNGLRSAGLGFTLFKPFDEKNFLLLQASADASGDYGWKRLPSFGNLRYSGALLYGRKVSDRFMWGAGISRTYRVGELNYVPVVLLNWTSASGKWGVECLLPARASLRRTFSPRSLATLGFELEGQSYRLENVDADIPVTSPNLELRRSELRLRLEYQRSLSGFYWIGIQAGLRYNYAFEVDGFGPDNQEFFRGFFGDQNYLIENTLAHTWYVQVTFNLVSP
jgi:hypothetical protein